MTNQTKNMRNIEEIIQELITHPDYITAQIYTWTNFLSETNEYFDKENNSNDLNEITLSDLSEEIKSEIVNYMEWVFEQYEKFSFSIYPNLKFNSKTKSFEIDENNFN